MNKIIEKYQNLINQSNIKKSKELNNINAQLIANKEELSEINKIIDGGIPNTEEYIEKLHRKEDLTKTNEMLSSYRKKIINEKNISNEELQYCNEEIEMEQFRIFNELSDKYGKLIDQFVFDVDEAYTEINELNNILREVESKLAKAMIPMSRTNFNEFGLNYIKNVIIETKWYKNRLDSEEASETNE